MVSWGEFARVEPEFAGRVQQVFDAHIHKTMATLRRDGSPRISGTEATFKTGQLWLGGGTTSVKVRDLLRDPRVAVHSAPLDTKMVAGDAKLSGRAVVENDESVLAQVFEVRPADATFLRLEIDEVVLTRGSGDRLVLELWTPGQGLRELPTA